MFAFFSGLPMVYRILGILAIVLALFSFGYYKGYSNEKQKFDAYKAEIVAIAKEQESKVKRINKEASKINKDVSNAYSNDVAAIRAYYQRLRGNASSGTVPTVSSAPKGTHGVPKDGLLSDCAETTLQLMYLQEWIVKQDENYNKSE